MSIDLMLMDPKRSTAKCRCGKPDLVMPFLDVDTLRIQESEKNSHLE
jgi:hypothetical protein